MSVQITFGARTLPREAVEERARRAAAAFRALGVGAGDVVAIILRNDFAFLETTVAAGYLGAYVTPVNWHATADEADYILHDCQPKAVVIHSDLVEGLRGAFPAGVPVLVVATPPDIRAAYGVAPDDPPAPDGARDWSAVVEAAVPLEPEAIESPGAMIYTSGTTGRPKGVRRRPPTPHEATEAGRMIAILFGNAGIDPADITALAAAPMYHSTPNAFVPHFYRLGANVIVHSRFDAEAMLAEIEASKVTHVLAVPTMFVRLLKLPQEVRDRYDVSSLRFVMHGAAPCPPEVKRAMIEWWGPVIWEHYGGTETSAITICDSAEWLAHPGTVGRAFEGAVLRILDDAGRPLPAGEIGEVACWRPTTSQFTYNGDDDKRARADRDGLVSLGDKGYLDADGFLHLSGRASDIVISGGVNIYPAEIEAELIRMPGVADCAVFGIPDEEFGEALCAHVQPHAGAQIEGEAVRGYLRGKVSGYKVPRVVVVSDTLPREDSGKIFKRKLREPYWAEAGRSI
ncbi:acyl-CoA synthetase [uncultured Phenylobacterium sp.]|uniref:acyl-CoA synthetase n=1 Tax=uncultured Phenylobacterium sp. TaxID=349273 RepID=UPI0025ED674E|nr:acyl-CoA synthetase [uncultured Phenylobacterium sp.]